MPSKAQKDLTFTIEESKKHFNKLIDLVVQGNEILISVSGKPAAKLSPISRPNRKKGVLKGKIKIAKDFDIPLQQWDL